MQGENGEVKANLTNSDIQNLHENCMTYSTRVVKTIRITLNAISDLMHQPDTRVLYYIRDPRAIINSRIKYHRRLARYDYNVNLDAALLCHTILMDYRHYKQLRQEYPERIFLQRYENLALYPQKVVANLYNDFLGINLPQSVVTWLDRSTTNYDNDDSLFGTARISREIVYQWKGDLTPDVRVIIEKECAEVLTVFGY